MLLDLPEDLFQHIIDILLTLHKPSLCVLARTCRVLQVPVERTLYHTVTLSTPRTFIERSRAVLLYDKACYIRRLAIELQLRHLELLARHFVPLTRQLLDAVTNLRHLELHYPAYARDWPPFLHDALPFRLQSLRTSTPFDAALTAFLNSQPELRALSLAPARSSAAPKLPLSALPELRDITTPDFLVALLCCARPVRTLRVRGRVYDGMLRALALGAALTRGLDTLEVEVVPSARNVGVLAATLGGVCALTIRIPSFETLEPLLDPDFGVALTGFARLRSFCVLPPPLTRVDASGEVFDEAVQHWMHLCAALKTVVLPGRSWGSALPD